MYAYAAVHIVVSITAMVNTDYTEAVHIMFEPILPVTANLGQGHQFIILVILAGIYSKNYIHP